jgi:hypothetical protein
MIEKTKTITFLSTGILGSAIDQPSPAKTMIPDWYKKMDMSVNGRFLREGHKAFLQQTMKSCVPVLDYLCSGYIITAPCDILVTTRGGVSEFSWNLNGPLIEMHGQSQTEGTPYENKLTYKINSPWYVKTPKGYSCLFLKPQYLDTKGIDVLPAVVDTDGYHQVNFPFHYNPKDTSDGEVVIPIGTPVMQVVPFKREAWVSEVGNLSKEQLEREAVSYNTVFKNFYRNLFHVKKSYR